MTKEIIAIWAEDEDGVIGLNQKLPWHLPKELKHFKNTTLNQSILMGRVTFDGMNRRILPDRQTLIMTRDDSLEIDGVLTMTSLEKVLEWYHAQEKNLYIIGGSQILEAFDGYFNKVIKTVVHGHFEGDTYAPQLDLSDYQEESHFFYEKDSENPYDFTVHVLVKK
ncbi:dihydrofolate reductase [Streptococcus didelphis]|uniref:Dihydrofolate reductase n=1 Tax=Streptococcus didelphis TaxID=102886 RepID=A0ABY9LHL0_9STRE|nr:dihydrofolate reductase [Streptococcus didelphis]WMB28317.1 dihydrofolate reductase [Streptococcus didelphis]